MRSGPHSAVVLGSMTLGDLLCFRTEAALLALSQGKPVYVYTPGLPAAGENRALAARIAAAGRELRALGIRFLEGRRRQVITGEEAEELLRRGNAAPPGAVLTPLAREILEGSD